MANAVLRFTVTLKGGLVASHPERRQESVVEQLENERIKGTVRKHSNGDWVKYRSGSSGRLLATILIDDPVDDMSLRKYERAIERGAGGNASGWSMRGFTI